MDAELLVDGQIERHAKALYKGIPAVRIAAIIGLAHARNNVMYALVAGKDSGNTDKEQVTSRNKGARIMSRLGALLFYSQATVGETTPAAQMAEKGKFHTMPFHTCLRCQLPGQVHFEGMFLAVMEGKGHHTAEVFQGPIHAGGTVLASAEDHQRT